MFISDEAALLELFPDAGGHALPARGRLRGAAAARLRRARSACSRSASARRVAFDADERGLLNALAAQAAIALARAELYEREHTVSQTLQASLLPRALPTVPGLDLGGPAGGRRPRASRSAATSTTRSRSTTPGWLAWRSATSAARGPMPPRSRRWPATRSAPRRATTRRPARSHCHPRRRPAAPRLSRGALPDRVCALSRAHRLRVVGRTGRRRTSAAAVPRGGRAPATWCRPAGRSSGCRGATWRATLLELDPATRLVLYTDGVTEAGRPRARAGARRAVRGARHSAAPRDARGCARGVLFEPSRWASPAYCRATTSPYSSSRSEAARSTAGRTPERESSTRGQCRVDSPPTRLRYRCCLTEEDRCAGPVGPPVWGPDCSHYWRCLGRHSPMARRGTH